MKFGFVQEFRRNSYLISDQLGKHSCSVSSHRAMGRPTLPAAPSQRQQTTRIKLLPIMPRVLLCTAMFHLPHSPGQLALKAGPCGLPGGLGGIQMTPKAHVARGRLLEVFVGPQLELSDGWELSSLSPSAAVKFGKQS